MITFGVTVLIILPPCSVAEADFENLGTTLETIVTGNTTLGATTFTLQQFHMHSPSEHRVNEEYFPLEVHMVHEGPNGEIAVIALLFQLTEDGSTTDLLTNVIEVSLYPAHVFLTVHADDLAYRTSTRS